MEKKENVLLRVLFALVSVIILGIVLSRIAAFFGQPPVIGEVLAGICLGPSLLGSEYSSWILPPLVAPYLSVIAQLGVLLYMFVVGLELNLDLFKARFSCAMIISHSSIVVPFLFGTILAVFLYPGLSVSGISFTPFALFLGVAMSITAFPVLARILTDRGMQTSELGVIALSSAAIGDVTAWLLLAIVVGIAKAQMGSGLWVTIGATLYILSMFFIVRPLLRNIIMRWESDRLSREATIFIYSCLLISALITEKIGIHAIFGAFLFGAVIPHNSVVAKAFAKQLESGVTVLLLPAFFAFTGMQTRVDLLSGTNNWLICALIIIVASVGKLGGAFLAAYYSGMDIRKSMVMGTLMNTRGLMELIVLNIGLELGVISQQLFAMMILMALATTMMTGPLCSILLKGQPEVQGNLQTEEYNEVLSPSQ
ncbi:MAG: cation:proton antiporter [Candidatus Riflebacteria bacterium]|nr:cation:proton antiporter [Candidatus Riflebacteria bacterium]